MKTQAIFAQPQAARGSTSRPNAYWRFVGKLFREKRLGAIGAVVMLNQAKLAFVAIAGFFLLASLAPFFMKKKRPE